MGPGRNASPLLTRELLVAVTAAVAAVVLLVTVFAWDWLPAAIGGVSIGVMWWSINRAFNREP